MIVMDGSGHLALPLPPTIAVTHDGRYGLEGRSRDLFLSDLRNQRTLHHLNVEARWNPVEVRIHGRLVESRRKLTQPLCGAIAPDARLALIGMSLSTLRLWYPASGVYREWEAHTGAVNSVALCRDGRRAVSGGEDCNVKIWDLESGVCLWTLRLEAAVRSVSLASDNCSLVVTTADGTISCWRIVWSLDFKE